jgi:hypothetical protein
MELENNLPPRRRGAEMEVINAYMVSLCRFFSASLRLGGERL